MAIDQCLSFGVASMQGWRDSMEDAHLALPDFDVERGYGLFGVFDGHGGAAVAELVAERLPGTLKGLAAYREGRCEEALRQTYLHLDNFLASPAGRKEVRIKSGGEGPDGMGTTAVVALVRRGTEQPEVIVANAGDSRCVLVTKALASDLSRDHAPTLPDERLRIRKAGGSVNHEGRVNGNLNLSRALGDLFYKKNKSLKPHEQLISGVPEIRRHALQLDDRCLILGCDGVWERYTSQEVSDFLLRNLFGSNRSDACGRFLDHNLSENPMKTDGLGCDNMSLMLVDLSGLKTQAEIPACAQAANPLFPVATVAATPMTEQPVPAAKPSAKAVAKAAVMAPAASVLARVVAPKRRFCISKTKRRLQLLRMANKS